MIENFWFVSSDWKMYCLCQFVSIFGKLSNIRLVDPISFIKFMLCYLVLFLIGIGKSCESLELEIKDLVFRQRGSDCILMLISLEIDAVFTSVAVPS